MTPAPPPPTPSQATHAAFAPAASAVAAIVPGGAVPQAAGFGTLLAALQAAPAVAQPDAPVAAPGAAVPGAAVARGGACAAPTEAAATVPDDEMEPGTRMSPARARGRGTGIERPVAGARGACHGRPRPADAAELGVAAPLNCLPDAIPSVKGAGVTPAVPRVADDAPGPEAATPSAEAGSGTVPVLAGAVETSADRGRAHGGPPAAPSEFDTGSAADPARPLAEAAPVAPVVNAVSAASPPAAGAPSVAAHPAVIVRAASPQALVADQAAATRHGTIAGQVTRALVGVARAADGTRRVDLHLQPETLGRLCVTVERPPDGPARVTIAVEKPATLAMLAHDQTGLAQALDQAGIPAQGRTVALRAGTDPPAQPALPHPPGATATVSAVPSGGMADAGGSAGSGEGAPARDRPAQGRTPHGDARTQGAAPTARSADVDHADRHGDRHDGLNITA